MEKIETLMQCVVCYIGFVGTLLFMSGLAGCWAAPSIAEAAASQYINDMFAGETAQQSEHEETMLEPVQHFIHQKIGHMLGHVQN